MITGLMTFLTHCHDSSQPNEIIDEHVDYHYELSSSNFNLINIMTQGSHTHTLKDLSCSLCMHRRDPLQPSRGLSWPRSSSKFNLVARYNQHKAHAHSKIYRLLTSPYRAWLRLVPQTSLYHSGCDLYRRLHYITLAATCTADFTIALAATCTADFTISPG